MLKNNNKKGFKNISKTLLILIIITNVFWAINQHIGIISEGSWDTEDWSNDAENSALSSQE